MSIYRYLLVLERKTRGRQLHLAKHFGPKMICDLFCTFFLKLKKALWGRNVLPSEAVYHASFPTSFTSHAHVEYNMPHVV